MAKRRFWKRDRKGRFAETNGGGVATKARPKSKKKASVRKVVANTGRSINRAKAVRTKKNNTPEKRAKIDSRNRRIEKGAQVALHGVQAVDAGRRAAGYLTASGATASFAPVAAVLGTKAAIAIAESANETHRVKTLTSKKYINGTVEERSKFDAGYGKRAKVINRANNATNLVGILGAATLVAGPTIKDKAARENAKRYRAAQGKKSYERTEAKFNDAMYKARGGTGPIVPRTGVNANPKEARRKRNGVYDITSKQGKRVA